MVRPRRRQIQQRVAKMQKDKTPKTPASGATPAAPGAPQASVFFLPWFGAMIWEKNWWMFEGDFFIFWVLGSYGSLLTQREKKK